MRVLIISTLFFFIYNSTASAAPDFTSKYSGQQDRVVKSLSAEDIKQLESGKGWGLAKAAELNGMPGPLHVLQMKKEIELTATQEKTIQVLYEQMKASAVPLGRELVRLEKELDAAFASKNITEDSLKQKLDLIAQAYSRLRFVHLVAHIKTERILRPQQVESYNRLRGYGDGESGQHKMHHHGH